MSSAGKEKRWLPRPAVDRPYRSAINRDYDRNLSKTGHNCAAGPTADRRSTGGAAALSRRPDLGTARVAGAIMPSWQYNHPPPNLASVLGVTDPRRLTRFLIESEQRVVAHCQAVLSRGDVDPRERDRLVSVLREATMRLQRLSAAAA